MSTLKEDKMQKMYQEMQVWDISIKEFFDYCNSRGENQPLRPVFVEPKKLELEVLYMDGTRSFFFRDYEAPVCIFVEKVKVALDGFTEVYWKEAKEACKSYSCSVFGKKCKWRMPTGEELRIISKNKDKINEVLSVFGRDALPRSWHWSSDEKGDKAWEMSMGSQDGDYYAKNGSDTRDNVRPVMV